MAPPPLVTWLKDGEEVNIGWERYRIVKHDTLQVRDVELDDTGIFVCRATNGFGSVEVQHLVYVITPGKLIFWSILRRA
jgi:Immunoglobulin I-set domain